LLPAGWSWGAGRGAAGAVAGAVTIAALTILIIIIMLNASTIVAHGHPGHNHQNGKFDCNRHKRNNCFRSIDRKFWLPSAFCSQLSSLQ
jgi:hypothetical protein